MFLMDSITSYLTPLTHRYSCYTWLSTPYVTGAKDIRLLFSLEYLHSRPQGWKKITTVILQLALESNTHKGGKHLLIPNQFWNSRLELFQVDIVIVIVIYCQITKILVQYSERNIVSGTTSRRASPRIDRGLVFSGKIIITPSRSCPKGKKITSIFEFPARLPDHYCRAPVPLLPQVNDQIWVACCKTCHFKTFLLLSFISGRYYICPQQQKLCRSATKMNPPLSSHTNFHLFKTTDN